MKKDVLKQDLKYSYLFLCLPYVLLFCCLHLFSILNPLRLGEIADTQLKNN